MIMSISGAKLRELAKNDPDGVARAFRKSLLDWYPTVTMDEVKTAVRKSLAGKNSPTDVIGVIVDKWFAEGIDDA